MAEFKNGGQLEEITTKKLETITINRSDDTRNFELWINRDSLSYLSVEELLDLRDECNNALRELLG